MPPDPIGTRPDSTLVLEPVARAPEAENETSDWYDRSSLPGDFMVMIDGQTEDDYLRRAPGRRCEFIDGIVYMPPSVHANHQFDVQLLLWLITSFHARRPVGIVQSGPTVLKLRDGRLVDPDLFVLPIGTKAAIQQEGMCRPPVLLVVEVLSPSTRSHDLVVKSALYREANVAEIWFVDRRDRVVLVERLEAGAYITERFERGPIVSRSLPGFWFDAAWLWNQPEPNPFDCLDQILAGPPPT